MRAVCCVSQAGFGGFLEVENLPGFGGCHSHICRIRARFQFEVGEYRWALGISSSSSDPFPTYKGGG